MTIVAFRQSLAPTRLGAALVGVTLAVSAISATNSLACGYHSPQAIAWGTLNWAFPNSLHVRTALWQAESAGILPPRQPQQVPPALAFRRASLTLRMLAERFSTVRARDTKLVNVSIVMIDSMLWTRLVAGPGGYTAQVDVSSAHEGDVVVVTTSKVIETMVRGLLDAKVAEAYGLIRLYRRPELHDDLRHLLRAVSRADHKPVELRPREKAKAEPRAMRSDGDSHR